jgi:hypothetical protein
MAVVGARVVKHVIVSHNLMIQAVVGGLLPFSKRHFLQVVSYIIITRKLLFPYY